MASDQLTTPVKQFCSKLDENTPKTKETIVNAIRDFNQLSDDNMCKAKHALQFEQKSPCQICGNICKGNKKLEVLHNNFKFKQFRDDQESILDCLLSEDRQAVVIIKPTSYGKSLLYELPCLYEKQVNKNDSKTIVIIPFVALCLDAKARCSKLGLNVLHVDKKMTEKVAIAILETQPVDIIFITPEKIQYNPNFLEYVVKQYPISSCVIDECHSIPESAFTFRGSMAKLAETIQSVGLSNKTLFMSATLPPDSLEQLLHMFQYDVTEFQLFVSDCYRQNFVIKVIPKDPSIENHNVQLLKFVSKLHLNKKRKENKEATLVYSRTRDRAEQLQKMLEPLDASAMYFHSGVSGIVKEEIVEQFKEKSCNLVSMTSGFGQGIDRDNVSSVVFDTMPNSTTSFLQIIGRCRRDGKGDANVVVFYNKDDVNKIASMIKAPQKGMKYNNEAINKKLKELQTISNILTDRRICINNLLAKVQFAIAKQACGKCSNCLANDFSSYMQIDNSVVSFIFGLSGLGSKEDVVEKVSSFFNLEKSIVVVLITELTNEGFLTFEYVSCMNVLKEKIIKTEKKYFASMYAFYINSNVYIIDFQNINGGMHKESEHVIDFIQQTGAAQKDVEVLKEDEEDELLKVEDEVKPIEIIVEDKVKPIEIFSIQTNLKRSLSPSNVNAGSSKKRQHALNSNSVELDPKTVPRKPLKNQKKLNISVHCAISESSSIYSCKMCEETFKTFESTKKHLISLHYTNVDSVKTDCLKCKIVLGTFSSKVSAQKISKHIMNH